jgi:SAM-dependent methyltransferase
MSRLCPLCGASNADAPRHRYSPAEWPLKECRSCSTLYLEEVPTYSQLAEELAWEKTFVQETKERSDRNPLLYRLGHLPKTLLQALTKRDKLRAYAGRYFAPGAVLDVGCAGGHTLARLPPQYEPCGIEISKTLSQRARHNFEPRGGFVICANALTGLQACDQDQFTGVIMTSFLEHEINPLAVLHATHRVMKPGGRLIIKVPNYACWNRTLTGERWCGFRFPDHVNYFTPTTLTQMLERASFRVVQFGLLDRMPTSDNMWLVAEAANGPSA